MAESSRSSFAWGAPSKSASELQTTVKKSEFPPLGSSAGSSSKSASRKRSLYNSHQRSNVNIYPPRHSVLAQRQLSHEGTFIHPDSDEHDIHDVSMNDESPIASQQNGMSSVTVYDRTGKRISNGPDIYSRHAKNYVKGKQRQRINDSSTSMELKSTERGITSFSHQNTFIVQQPQPSPLHLTKDRINLLISESQRLKRVKAARSRQEAKVEIQEDDQEDPLLQQITRAFSSINNFKTAFAKDNT